ncbi:TetR/AcrR family transcriptional regulator [Streptomyces albipurpureus]|uniref:TetR/AcrR family transcriptional regulator C-terminal domain-containing protein n=1 Tax=Streptomyces albipurpureus TaxID=2897419 RepID=A0ABT0V081_9ACTN|nr:TetR/AcrR family transcriptional regulator C-terminal domain-containing protein [Streptomyces sp. CWNU-1]MCM2394252.1 TetR/AcrR family transcriptional regulator C-terminal domain-containing protein [Streptomyces sp. CWNU-1]
MTHSGDDAQTGLPASLEAAWGLRERPAKGPRPGLSLDRIVDAAVALAAAEGLGAVSMGRVAKELGVATMSLYRYVAAKDELYVLMLDAAVGPPPPAPAPEAGWRQALAGWARAHRGALRRNSWVLRIPISGPPATPNSVAWWEQGLCALEGTKLDEGAKISVILLVSGFVRNEVLLLTEIGEAVASSGTGPEEVMRRYERTLKRLADPARYPAVARMLSAGVFTGADEPDFDFEFGLGTVLDGVDVLIARRSGERGG